MKKLFALLTVLAIISVFAGCTPKTFTAATQERFQTTTTSPEIRPYWPTKEWQVTDPEKQDMDVNALNQITRYVQDSKLDADSVIVVRHGYIVYEKYFRPPWDKGQVHNIYSCTKSVMGSLVGIAVQRGKIKSLDDKMVDYFPNRAIQNLEKRKRSVTLLNLMT